MNLADKKILKAMEPCMEALLWITRSKLTSLHEVWDKCERSDWLTWWLDKIRYTDDRKLRLFACKCVRETHLHDGRMVWDLLTDERSRKAVEVAERYARGQATGEELEEARDDASDAAYAYVYDAAYAASDAAYAASDASDAYAASAASDAASYASDASASAYNSDGASYASAYAYAAARKEQCALLRDLIPWEEVEEALAIYSKGLKEDK